MSNKNEVVLSVEGMTCSSCVRHVESALRELDGIEAVEVTLKDGRVRVEHDPTRSTLAQMVEALGEAGYASRGAA
ncbi:MAG: heavy-metal-associated domain-containing protein [Myxococcales bacterium]|mgnify:CR=1 FL=1|nr:heavy-metal-associated domain-containing protein [Myxococcales bacterium]